MLGLGKGGYLQIDLMFAILLFFLLFLHLYFIGDSFYERQELNFESKNLQAQANDFCFLLVNSPGFPINWESNLENLEFVGLKGVGEINLSTSKISALNTTNYVSILRSTDLDDFFNVKIIGLDSGTVYNNLNTTPYNPDYSEVAVCYANYNSEIVKVIVGVWK